MKIIHAAKTAIDKVLSFTGNGGAGAPALDVEKRKGVFVGRFLEPRNAAKWHAWAVKHGVPNPIPPEELHVTVVYSLVDVKLARDERAFTIYTGPGYGDAGAFCMFGPKNDTLVFCFDSWDLYNRHHEFIRNGGITTWPSYRPHLSLSYDSAGFELSDEALADVPTYIVMLSEENRDPNPPSTGPGADDAQGEDDDDLTVVVVIDIAKAAAAELLEKHQTEKILSVMDAYDVADVARGRVSRAAAKRLAAAEWAPEAFKALADAEKAAPEPAARVVDRSAMKSREVALKITDFPADVKKSLGARPVVKFEDAERMIYGIASVSTVDGVLIEDHHGAKITTDCLREFTHDIIRGQRAGKFDHEGEVCNEIVEALVFSDDIQKSLGISLGYEPLLIGMHVPNDQDWKAVCDGDWMFSIAGLLYYTEEGAQADAA